MRKTFYFGLPKLAARPMTGSLPSERVREAQEQFQIAARSMVERFEDKGMAHGTDFTISKYNLLIIRVDTHTPEATLMMNLLGEHDLDFVPARGFLEKGQV